MLLRSGNVVGSPPTTTAKLNEYIVRLIHKINREKSKHRKIKRIFDLYAFLYDSRDILLVSRYRIFIETVVDKTQHHMKTMEEKYFPEMITIQEKIDMFDCYYMLSRVKNAFIKYLATFVGGPSSADLA